MEPIPYTLPSEAEMAERVRRTLEADAKRRITFAKQMQKRQRGTKHAPGETKATREDRAALERKRKAQAKKSKRKNRRR